MKNGYLVVATKEELDLPAARMAMREQNLPAIITGVGGTNVIRALRDIPKDTYLINVGYCGSTFIPKGTECEISCTSLYHPNCDFDEPLLTLFSGGSVRCLTAGDFVQGGELPRGCVCDMELAYIAALGFTHLRSVKYVSDGLDYKEYAEASGNAK